MRSVRVRVVAGAAVVSLALLAVAPGAVGAQEGDPTAPTEPPPTVPSDPTPVPTTVPTTVPSDPTPAPTTPPTTLPSTPPTIPSSPSGERSALSPEQTIAAQAELATLTDSQRQLLRQLQASRDALAGRRFALVALAREVTLAQSRLDQARSVERAAQDRVEETAGELRLLKEEVVGLAAAAYRNHTANRTLGAIGSIDASRASTVARAQTYAQSDLTFLGVRVDSLAALERRLEAEQHKAQSARAEAEASAADVDARLAEQQQAFDAAADATLRAQTAVARSLGADARLLAQMVDPHFGADDITAVLAHVQAGQGEPQALDGIFGLPVPGAHLSSAYGVRIDPIAGTIGYHAGLDFAAGARTPIHAAAGGIVVVAGDCGGYGSCVVIDHGSSIATVYGHQSQLLVRVGDAVAPAQVVGLVGSTGISTGPHLHFEVRIHGAPIDPVPTLTA